MTPTLTFTCSICGEPSVSICVYCTKDTCPNHLCERCNRCSDCCECDVRLESHPEREPVYEYTVTSTFIETPVDGMHPPRSEQPLLPDEPQGIARAEESHVNDESDSAERPHEVPPPQATDPEHSA